MAPPPDGDRGGKGQEPLAEWSSDEADLLRGLFLAEAEGHLRQIADAQQALARIADGEPGATAQAIAGLYRELHSLKGAAGSVGFGAISRAAHDLAEPCAEIQGGRLAATRGVLGRVDEGGARRRRPLGWARPA